jgi:RNA polymerase sigma factor (sigma-70 family)
MERDTDMGGARDRFPETRLSVVRATGSPDPDVRRRALHVLVASYWKPVYKYLRLCWKADNEEAKDLTQGFFASAIDREILARYDPGKAKFRTWLRTCLDGYVSNERKALRRLKRGGDVRHVPLDFETAEGELAAHAVPDFADPETLFHREWVRSLFALAVGELRDLCEAEGKQSAFAMFRRYDLEGPGAAERISYADLAREHGLDVTTVTNRLHAVRKRFRAIVLDRLRELCASDAEFRDEARDLLGSENP